MSMLVISAAQALDMKVHCCAQPPHVSRNGCWCLLADVAAVPLQKAATVIGTTRKKIRMASPEQVYEATGCLTGAVPPFGSPFNIPTFIDDSVIEQGETINFNAVRGGCSRASVSWVVLTERERVAVWQGMRTKSIQMSVADYLAAENPTKASFRS